MFNTLSALTFLANPAHPSTESCTSATHVSTNVQGSFVLIRHLADGTIYRVKSNSIYGLSLGTRVSNGEPYGWASFSGKGTYQEPTWMEPVGNYEFAVYVEDRNEPGSGVDRI